MNATQATEVVGKKALFQIGGDLNAIVEGVLNEIAKGDKFVRLDTETAAGVVQTWHRIEYLTVVADLTEEEPVP